MMADSNKANGSLPTVTTLPDERPTILLIGATGQVGWELSRSLASLGRVVATYRRAAAGLVTPLLLDLRREETIFSAIRTFRPALIVNAAAYTDVDGAETEPERAMVVNAAAPRVLAQEAKRIGAALVHYSTDYVFDGRGDHPWREEDPPAPLNAYGRSKLAGEEAVRSAGGSHFILRTSWVYGVHGANFVKTMLRRGFERSKLQVVDDQFGAPTSARVVADVTAQLLAQAKGHFAEFLQEHGGTYHVSCSGEVSWHGLATEVCRLARRHGLPLIVEQIEPVRSSQYSTAAKRPHNSRLDSGRLAETFGLVPPDWRIALGHCLDEMLGTSLCELPAKVHGRWNVKQPKAEAVP